MNVNHEMNPPDMEVLAELVRQGVADDDALVIVRHLPTVDWNRIFWDREELARKAGVAMATVSYEATRTNSERSIRPACLPAFAAAVAQGPKFARCGDDHSGWSATTSSVRGIRPGWTAQMTTCVSLTRYTMR
jgi:hypothetical protein